MMHVTDFYPTLIHMAGGSIEQNLPIDGINMTSMILQGAKSQREEIIFEVSNSVRPPALRLGDYKLIGEELYNIIEDPKEQVDLATVSPDIALRLKARIDAVGNERPPMPNMELLMTPALPWVYGQKENANVPEWVKEHMRPIRAAQPQEWAKGTTPWPQAPVDGKIIYTGDGR